MQINKGLFVSVGVPAVSTPLIYLAFTSLSERLKYYLHTFRSPQWPFNWLNEVIERLSVLKKKKKHI